MQARIAVLSREVEALRLAGRGELEVLRGDHAAARDLLERAFDMSTFERDTINEKLILVQEREVERRYRDAKDLELQGRYEDALADYRVIDEAMPGYLDVRARINQLEEGLAEAERSYRAGVEAEERGEIDAAIEAFADTILFLPGYKDARERLARLRIRS